LPTWAAAGVAPNASSADVANLARDSRTGLLLMGASGQNELIDAIDALGGANPPERYAGRRLDVCSSLLKGLRDCAVCDHARLIEGLQHAENRCPASLSE
jgi:hypothetical protein